MMATVVMQRFGIPGRIVVCVWKTGRNSRRIVERPCRALMIDGTLAGRTACLTLHKKLTGELLGNSPRLPGPSHAGLNILASTMLQPLYGGCHAEDLAKDPANFSEPRYDV
jgi:hypothetical protein